MGNRTTWDSVKSLFSPQTIPMLISQGVHKKLFPLGTLLLGMALAFVWAYVIFPTIQVDTGPLHLSPSWKTEYVKQVAWQFQASQNAPNAIKQLSELGDGATVINGMLLDPNLMSDVQLAPALQNLSQAAQGANFQDDPNKLSVITPTLLNSNYTPLLCILAAALLIGLPIVVNTIIPFSLIFAPKSKDKPTVQVGLDAERRKIQQEALAKSKAEVPPAPVPGVQTVDRGVPVSQFMSTYVMGDDLYDDSFSIETKSGEFLGETGGGISKTIGVGDPKKVTAVEVWVFDKNDIRTVTKVLMSEHAFNDPALKAELATKGEAVLAKPGAIALLETQTLIVQARVVDMAYGSGALPNNSYYERISVEISAWPKKADDSSAGAPAPIKLGQ
jgi:hypothetical protein